jgi:hypothetical protein
MPDPQVTGHQIATRAAQTFVKECQAAELSWTEAAVACESFVTIIAVYCAQMSRTPSPKLFAQEIIDSITERAHERAQAYLKETP